MTDVLRKVLHALGQLDSIVRRLSRLARRVDRIEQALGRIEARQTAASLAGFPASHEFRVYSQWGEDGILQALVREVPIARKVFVEFGVETYVESNTRFLLVNDNWSGLVLDGSRDNIETIKRDPLYWQYNLKAVEAFITKDNINDLLRQNGVTGEIGLLSIDIDGNDYWVWERIDVVNPAIIVAEYNSLFGAERAVTVPYDPTFQRAKAHYSHIYYGASLAALVHLANQRGYDFVGANTAGNNAFFVRRDLRPDSLPALTAKEGFVPRAFREGRTPEGQLSLLTPEEEAALVQSLPVVEITA